MVSFICTETLFGSYTDLTSNDGHDYIYKRNFRHYLICSAPRIIFKSFDFMKKEIEIYIQRNVTEFDKKNLRINTCIEKDGLKTEINKIECTEYPEIKVIFSNKSECLFASCYEFLCHFLPEDNTILTHEILYIGQTKTTKKYLRLKGHEKIAKISDNILKSAPQLELFVKLLKFESPVCEIDSPQKNTASKTLDDLNKMVRSFTDNEITNLIEAVLIKSCQPKYNTHYTNNFPNKEHQKYNFIYNKSIDIVSIFIDERSKCYRLELEGKLRKALLLTVTLDDFFKMSHS